MSENSKIEWTDHTFNPWIGCTKVSPGCAHCYAETQNNLRKWNPAGWGKGVPRKRTSAANWKQPLKWNLQGFGLCPDCGRELLTTLDSATGKPKTIQVCPCGSDEPALTPRRPRVFCSSLADWLDDEVPAEWLFDLLSLIHKTPNIDWLLLTKRPENFEERLRAAAAQCTIDPLDITDRIYSWLAARTEYSRIPMNVWIGTTVEDQQRADERIPALLQIPARVRFLSCEPLLGEVRLHRLLLAWPSGMKPIHWVIAGGESGQGARPMRPQWAQSLRDQCQAAGVPFLFKQWGEWAPMRDDGPKGAFHFWGSNLDGVERIGKRAAGRMLDSREWNEFPQ